MKNNFYDLWRKFLNEDKAPITKLRIFDFDETIAWTEGEIRAIDPEGQLHSFPDQKSWDSFLMNMGGASGLEKQGWKFDFSDYDHVLDPIENKKITKIISQILRANMKDEHRELYVLTARNPEIRGPIRDYLHSIDIDADAFADIIGTGGGSKKEEIKKIIDSHRGAVEDVHFFDDSMKNILDARKLVEEYPQIKFRFVHVSPGGIRAIK